MKPSINNENINNRCEFLKELGFTIIHEDSNVSLSGMNFDFSATQMDAKSILSTVIKETRAKAIEDGKNKLRKQLNALLNPASS